MRTLLLDVQTWDLAVDAAGNIAVADDPYSQAQDAASAMRTFAGEVYYETTLGIPYFSQVLGKTPPISLVKAYLVQAAETVPGVASAVCYLSAWQNRVLSGQVQITNSDGDTSASSF